MVIVSQHSFFCNANKDTFLGKCGSTLFAVSMVKYLRVINMKYALAIDIGASSGRHIVGWLEDGTIQTKEVYRFPNGASVEPFI